MKIKFANRAFTIKKRWLSWRIGTDFEIDNIDDFDGEKAKQIHHYGLQQFWHHQQISKQSCWTILEEFAAAHGVEIKDFFLAANLRETKLQWIWSFQGSLILTNENFSSENVHNSSKAQFRAKTNFT